MLLGSLGTFVWWHGLDRGLGIAWPTPSTLVLDDSQICRLRLSSWHIVRIYLGIHP